jgi:pimeloyl-ACP methyl ester carboxylesterase
VPVTGVSTQPERAELPELPDLPGRGDPPIPPFGGERVSAGAFALFVRRTPVLDGVEPALYVHGLGGASTNWTDLMHLLAPTLAGEAPDLPGFGYSEPPPDNRYRLGMHVTAVTALLEESGRGPVHLFGNSLGGAVATRIAAERPDQVRTLTLISPALPTYLPKASAARLPALLVPGMGQLLIRRTAAMPAEDQVQAVLDLCYADATDVPPERFREAVQELRRRSQLPHTGDALVHSLQGLLLAYSEAGKKNLWRLAARVQAPTLLIFGTRDKLVDVRIAPKAARTFPDNRLLVLDGVGHVAQLERPITVAHAVLDRLGRVRRRTAASGPTD